jgi:hypothetical protein
MISRHTSTAECESGRQTFSKYSTVQDRKSKSVRGRLQVVERSRLGRDDEVSLRLTVDEIVLYIIGQKHIMTTLSLSAFPLITTTGLPSGTPPKGPKYRGGSASLSQCRYQSFLTCRVRSSLSGESLSERLLPSSQGSKIAYHKRC